MRRVPLSTGVTLNVAVAGVPDAPPVILLHGFPESHRTWREIAPRVEGDFHLDVVYLLIDVKNIVIDHFLTEI